MSTALLQEVYQEARRLYVAGSDLATDDFRLNRLLPKLQQLGERSPVFKRISDGVATLIANQESSKSAEQLQRLTLLVLSVLRTQGTTASLSQEEGNATPLQNKPSELNTRLTYRQIAPVQQALSTTGGGRYEIVQKAWEQDYFNDMRLLPLAIRALADPYVEIADLAMKSIVPGYGEIVLPYLMENFDPQGGKLEVRKLKAIQQIAGESYADFYLTIAEQTKGDMKAAAIGGLNGSEQHIPALLEWSKDKKKEVRAVAYEALARSSSPEAQDLLFNNFTDASRDLELVREALASEAVRGTLQPELAKRLHAAAWEALEAVATHPPDDVRVARYNSELQAYFRVWSLHDREELRDMYRFMLKHAEHFEVMLIDDTYSKRTLLSEAAYDVGHYGNDDDVELLYALEERYPDYIVPACVAAHRLRSPQEMYERFSRGLGAGSSRGGRNATPNSHRLFAWLEDQLILHRDEEVELLYTDGEVSQYNLWFHTLLPVEELQQHWDPRWLNIALEHHQDKLAAALARPGVPELTAMLRETIVDRGDFSHQETGLFFRAIERTGISLQEIRDMFWEAMEGKQGGASSTIDPFILRLIERFPVEDIERLEQLIPDSDSVRKGKIIYTAASQLRAVVNKMKEMNT